jgi:hypothetical protein
LGEETIGDEICRLMVRSGEGGLRTGFWWESRKEIDQLEDLGVDRKIILKRIFKK